MRYFIGNWKMFGVPKSINILNKINNFHSKDKNRKKYKVVITLHTPLLKHMRSTSRIKNFLLVHKIVIKRPVFIKHSCS